jgi:hypothetical protein
MCTSRLTLLVVALGAIAAPAIAADKEFTGRMLKVAAVDDRYEVILEDAQGIAHFTVTDNAGLQILAEAAYRSGQKAVTITADDIALKSMAFPEKVRFTKPTPGNYSRVNVVRLSASGAAWHAYLQLDTKEVVEASVEKQSLQRLVSLAYADKLEINELDIDGKGRVTKVNLPNQGPPPK